MSTPRSTSKSTPGSTPGSGSTAVAVTFATLLKRYRRAAGLTQEELAERASLSVNAVSALERAVNQSPRRDTVALLADALGLAGAERAQFEAAARGRSVGGSGGSDAATTTSAIDPDMRTGEAPLPLIGREREAALLRRLLAPSSSADAQPPLLLFTGEPGIGKSRLLAEAARMARPIGWTVLAGRCYRRGGQEPFAPLLDALAGWIHRAPPAHLRNVLADCSWLARLLPELVDAGLMTPPRWSLPADQERRLIFAAVDRFLAQIAGPAGTLLLLDDLQWAGTDALDLAAALLRCARADGGPRVLVIGTYRGTELARESPLALLLADLARERRVVQRELRRLGADEASQLLRRLLDAEHGGGESIAATTESDGAAESLAHNLAPEVERALRLAEGVPFFLVSYVQAMRLPREDATAPGEKTMSASGESEPTRAVDDVPWEVAQSIRARIGALPPTALHVLNAAAVAGREVPRGVLLAAVGSLAESIAGPAPQDGLLDALDAACQARLLIESGEQTYAFGHDLIREVVLADLSAARRELLHRRVAEALERLPGEPPAERLAFHYARAGLSEKAIAYLARAGDRAAAAHAYAVAADAYRELVERLDTAGRIPEAARAREQLGLALRNLGRNDEALVCFEIALRVFQECGELERMAWAAAQLGWAHVARGAPWEGFEPLQALLRVFEEVEYPYGMALLHTVLADLHYTAGDYPRQLAAAERAVLLARSIAEAQLLTQAEQLRGRALLLLGPLDDGLAVMRAAIHFSQARDDLPNLCLALCMASLGCWLQGRFDQQREYVEQAMASAMRLGDPALLALAGSGLGMVAWYRGEWAEARGRLAGAEAAIRHAEARLVEPYVAGVLGLMELATGESGVARLEHAARSAARIGDLVPQRFAQAALAEDDLLHGRADQARARLLPLLDHAGRRETFATPLAALVAWAELELGEHEQADTRSDEALSRARAEGQRLALVDALRVRAMVATRRQRWSDAACALDDATTLAAAMPYPYATAKILYAYGRLLAAQGKHEQAHERFEQALAVCGRLGERLYAAQIGHALAALGAGVKRAPRQRHT